MSNLSHRSSGVIIGESSKVLTITKADGHSTKQQHCFTVCTYIVYASSSFYRSSEYRYSAVQEIAM